MTRPQERDASPEALDVGDAITHVSAGGLLGFPTETSWGLAVDARSQAALDRLLAAKGRATDHVVSVLVADRAGLGLVDAEVSAVADALLASFWPGPLTIVLPCRPGEFARGVANAEGGVGFRCSPHPVARALAETAQRRGVGPLTATSLNRSGDPPCSLRADALSFAAACEEQGVALVAGPDAGRAPASTVIDATAGRLRVLREGAIARADLHRIVPGELAA